MITELTQAIQAIKNINKLPEEAEMLIQELLEAYSNKISEQKDTLKPYINYISIETNREYNPLYGDHRICKCGHSYDRHFDSFKNNEVCGCKYCRCYTFEEK